MPYKKPIRKFTGACAKPDRDFPKLTCGYPLPCPHHMVVVDTTKEAVTVTTPIAASDAIHARGRLLEIGAAVKRGTK
jgi:hypothetical protein